MKIKSIFCALAVFTAIIALPRLGMAQFSIPWSTVDGGGGTSTGGTFSVSGTIGQADAGQAPMTGGTFSLAGGFWGVFAVPTPEAPMLRVERSAPNTVVIAWPAPSTGWSLLRSPTMAPGSWVPAPDRIVVVGSENQVIISPPAGIWFYRLQQ